MNRKQKKELRQRQSTRQLMGIVRVTPHGIVTDFGERVFFLIQPDNLSVLSPEVIRGRVRSLTMLLSTQPTLGNSGSGLPRILPAEQGVLPAATGGGNGACRAGAAGAGHGPFGRHPVLIRLLPQICAGAFPLDRKSRVRRKARCGSWRKPSATTGSACVWRRSRM